MTLLTAASLPPLAFDQQLVFPGGDLDRPVDACLGDVNLLADHTYADLVFRIVDFNDERALSRLHQEGHDSQGGNEEDHRQTMDALHETRDIMVNGQIFGIKGQTAT